MRGNIFAIIFVMLVSTFQAIASVPPQIEKPSGRCIDSLFIRHSGEVGFSSVSYGDKMLSIMKASVADEGTRRLLGQLKLIRILVCREQGGTEKLFLSELDSISARYGSISEVADDGKVTKFLLKSEDGGLSSFLMISESADAVTALDIYGNFDVKDISRLSRLGK